jgi:hypothetical protein
LRNKYTGVVTYQAYFEHGKRHRADGLPAIIRRNLETGDIIREAYWESCKRVDRLHDPYYQFNIDPPPTLSRR